MVAGITFSICSSALVVWVVIALAWGPSFIQKILQRLRKVARCLLTIFAHPHECGPVPGTENGENDERGQFEFTIRRNKVIKIRKLNGGSVADSFDTIKRDAAHFG